MLHRNRRAHRAVAIFSLALAAAGAAAIVVPGTASANDVEPSVRARIEGRTLLVLGGAGNEVLTLRSPAAAPTTIDVDLGNDGVAEATFQRADIDYVEVRARGGDDWVLIDETAGVAVPFTDTLPTTINGQAGDDLLLGGSGAEHFQGGEGFDVVDGNRGNDTAELGSEDDEFIWDPGDGSDTIEGQRGNDLMTFNGAAGNEKFAAVDNGGRLRFTRNVGNIVMDTDSVERVTVNTLGGSDFVEIDDLAGAGVKTIDVDGGADARRRRARRCHRQRLRRRHGGQRRRRHLRQRRQRVHRRAVHHREHHRRRDDRPAARSPPWVATTASTPRCSAADTMHLDVLGGDGDDVLLGGDGAEKFLAGEGADFVDGNRGNDDADMEAGDDEFLWDPGDGSDIVEGADGYDVMTFNGSSGDEIFATTSLGDRMAFTRNLGNIFMDTNNVEAIDLRALGGADQLTLGDATGTELVAFHANLAAAIGGAGGDGLVDTITVLGTPGDDAISVTGANGAVQVAGLASTVDITNADPTDRLTVNGNGGTDTIDSAGLAAGTMEFTAV